MAKLLLATCVVFCTAEFRPATRLWSHVGSSSLVSTEKLIIHYLESYQKQ